MADRIGREQAARHRCWRLGFKEAGILPGTAFHPHPVRMMADVVRHLGAAVSQKSGNRPFSVHDHLNAAFRMNQNRQIADWPATTGRLRRCFEDSSRVFQKPAHKMLIARMAISLNPAEKRPRAADEHVEANSMNQVHMIGLRREELTWVRLLVALLRHPDPVVPELSRQAIRYVETVAGRTKTQPELRKSGEL